MKKIILTVLIGLASVAHAQHRHGHYGGGWGYNWVAPAVIGGVVTYALTRPPVVVQQQPVIVQQPPVVYQPQPNCSPWVETRNPDGTITRTRTCSQ